MCIVCEGVNVHILSDISWILLIEHWMQCQPIETKLFEQKIENKAKPLRASKLILFCHAFDGNDHDSVIILRKKIVLSMHVYLIWCHIFVHFLLFHFRFVLTRSLFLFRLLLLSIFWSAAKWISIHQTNMRIQLQLSQPMYSNWIVWNVDRLRKTRIEQFQRLECVNWCS